MKKLLKKIYLKSTNKSLPYSLNSVKIDCQVLSLDEPTATISFDDQSPVYDVDRNIDYGIINGVLDNYLDELLNKNVAITSFVIPKFNINGFEDNQFMLKKHKLWYSKLNKLQSNKFEVAIHGLAHYQNKTPFQNHCEFAFISNNDFEIKLKKSIELFQEIGFNPKGFRQPGWDFSTDISLDTFSKSGLDYIAGSSLDAGLNSTNLNMDKIFPCKINNLINMPQNIELKWGFDKITNEIDRIISLNGLVSIKAHFADNKVVNSLDKDNRIKLFEIVDYINDKHNIQWKTFKDILKIV